MKTEKDVREKMVNINVEMMAISREIREKEEGALSVEDKVDIDLLKEDRLILNSQYSILLWVLKN